MGARLTPAAARLLPSPLPAPTPTRSLNSSLNLLNKWALSVGGFRFPFLLTSCAPCSLGRMRDGGSLPYARLG